MSLSNPATAGTPLLNAPVAVPANIEQLVTSVGLEAATAPVSFSTVGGLSSFGPPASFGNDAVVNQQIQNQNQNQGNQSCASNGGQQENCQGQQGQ
jgi:hypothetical protein